MTAALGGLAFQVHAVHQKLDELDKKLSPAEEIDAPLDSPRTEVPGPRAGMSVGALRLVVREELERLHAAPRENSDETSEERAEREASMEQGAESEAHELVASLLHRETTFSDWEALGSKIATLNGDEYRDAVKRRILVFINRQELRPPEGVNPAMALDGDLRRPE
jgi:hypothetical protein